MRKRLLLPLCLLLIMPVRAEFDFEAYQAASFVEIMAQHSDDLLKASLKSDYIVSAATFKYRIPVIFVKDLRKLSSANRLVIKAWQKTLRVPDGFVDLYQHEFRVEFANQSYWIPVQEGLLLPMGTELHPGDQFELYVIVIGAVNNKLVLLTTEFKSDRSPE